jgi:hypothetical protein
MNKTMTRILWNGWKSFRSRWLFGGKSRVHEARGLVVVCEGYVFDS